MDLAAAWVLVPVFAVLLPALVLPGPDFVGVVRPALVRGTRAGVWTTLGVTTGLGLYATLGLAGLAAVLVQYQWLAVRVLGGGWLVYLGLRLLLARPRPLDLAGDAAALARSDMNRPNAPLH